MTAFNTNLQLAPIGSLEAYINWTHSIPVLSVEEEKNLMGKIYNESDLEAVRKLILSHLRFVVYVSRSYMGYGLSHADIIQEGNVGLMKAIKRFDPKVGVRLVSFAIYWIKSEIQEYILKNWRIVKVATTNAQRKLFFKLRKYMKSSGAFTADEVSYIASTLNVAENDVRTMESRLSSQEMSFDGLQDDTDQEKPMANAPSQYLTSAHDDTPEYSLIQATESTQHNRALQLALSSLDDRAKDIIYKRWLTDGKKATLHELADAYAISAERVRQLEKQALAKLKESITAAV